MIELPNLHDAVLERIEIDWDRGVAAVEVTLVPGGAARVECLALRSFELGRRQEWGPSVFINAAELRGADDGDEELWIEIQSGDVLRIVAERVTVTALDDDADQSTA